MSDLQWRKAGRSANNGACVEVAPARDQIFVRDSKDQDGPMMRYPMASWKIFLSDVKKDQFDLAQLLRHSSPYSDLSAIESLI
jgi:hypothetical protein